MRTPVTRSPGSRRAFLASMGAAGVALASCTSDDSPTGEGLDLVLLFSPAVLGAGRPERLSFGLKQAGDTGALILGNGGKAQVRILNGTTVLLEDNVEGRVVAHDHPDGEDVHQHDTNLKYFSVRPTFPVAGSYTLQVEWQGRQVELSVPVNQASAVAVPGVGDIMPAFPTPTTADPLGVDPLCTRQPPCSFHDVSLTDVAGKGVPLALLVATPSFCQTAFCGPVLDIMIRSSRNFPSVEFMHAEVYRNPTGDGGLANPDLQVSPAMSGLNLQFEPSLFLVDGDGIVRDRIDNVFDEQELDEALESLTRAS